MMKRLISVVLLLTILALPMCSCLAASSTEEFYNKNLPGHWQRWKAGGTKAYTSACPYDLDISLNDNSFLVFYSDNDVYFACSTDNFDGCVGGRLLLSSDGKCMMFYNEDGTTVVYKKK